MYKVTIGYECPCFQRSEYKSEKEFDNQQDAYNYTNIVTEFMNEEFCSSHLFFAQRASETEFVVAVSENPNGGGCSTGSCSTDTAELSDSSCGTSCGCS